MMSTLYDAPLDAGGVSKLKAGEAVIRVEDDRASDLLVVSGNGWALRIRRTRIASQAQQDLPHLMDGQDC